ncbi:hypothetical protein N2W54_000066 [Lotmaria passim]
MQPHLEPPSATTSRGGGASDTATTSRCHSANTAKAHQALSLFACIKANLSSASAATASGLNNNNGGNTGIAATRRGSAPAGQAHTPRATPRSADNSSLQYSSRSLTSKQRRSSSVSSTSPLSPQHAGTASASSSTATTTASAQPLTYTEAELSSMSPAQLRRQLRLASAVTQRLHRRTQQLQREVEALKTMSTEHQLKGKQQGVQREAKEGVLTNEQTSHVERERTAAVASTASAAAGRDIESEMALLRDTVQQQQRRLELSEEQRQRAMQLQLDALLQHSSAADGSRPAAPTPSIVNAEVQKLFKLMQDQLVANATQQQVERARMNELFYLLERQRGLM